MTEAPEQLHKKFQDAFNRHDLEAIVALYEPAAVLAGRDATLRGTDAIRAAYRRFLEPGISIEVETLCVNRVDELAMLQGKWIVRGTASDGQPITREGRNSETVRLQPDGRWLCHRPPRTKA